MSNNDVVRAWKDPKYRASLSAAQQAALPANPAGGMDLSDEELGQKSGFLSALSFCLTVQQFYCW